MASLASSTMTCMYGNLPYLKLSCLIMGMCHGYASWLCVYLNVPRKKRKKYLTKEILRMVWEGLRVLEGLKRPHGPERALTGPRRHRKKIHPISYNVGYTTRHCSLRQRARISLPITIPHRSASLSPPPPIPNHLALSYLRILYPLHIAPPPPDPVPASIIPD